ncbi:MAG: hypothetical protein COS68_03985 [Elusimicrobia bacterium CG06_land_8_20_14_3_00_38_11]|nr:MAG: hypothetical protein COS68_03985 [Elusimicrobia bacterium CG06_land_8_20_14_3_00_38_11]
MKKTWISVVLFLILNILTFVIAEPKQQKLIGDVRFEIKAYKDKYDLKEPIVILYKISVKQSPHGGTYTFCIYPQNYVFAIKIKNAKGESLNFDKFINDGMSIQELRTYLSFSYDNFISAGVNQPYLGYIAINDFWDSIASLAAGKYFTTVKFAPAITDYLHSNNRQHVDNAWTGELISNEIVINLVNN